MKFFPSCFRTIYMQKTRLQSRLAGVGEEIKRNIFILNRVYSVSKKTLDTLNHQKTMKNEEKSLAAYSGPIAEDDFKSQFIVSSDTCINGRDGWMD